MAKSSLTHEYALRALAPQYGLTRDGDIPVAPDFDEALIRAQIANEDVVAYTPEEIEDMLAFQEQLAETGIRLPILDKALKLVS